MRIRPIDSCPPLLPFTPTDDPNWPMASKRCCYCANWMRENDFIRSSGHVAYQSPGDDPIALVLAPTLFGDCCSHCGFIL
ncbi:hypothetical protein K443DRAFT_15560 [Laccaria amethystina LaAM-08-1]|uniref:Uncharacterized protein n=1 Tax=Laccaria amethystina LaAM-08-1 TaxID=1095629 RepID=A0A0C9WQP2_9AGAR|nr:hypothetical protein K443DRAFT_15560 [Laccaria amethystina LaAM-08-1]